jgi:hypothetical protein
MFQKYLPNAAGGLLQQQPKEAEHEKELQPVDYPLAEKLWYKEQYKKRREAEKQQGMDLDNLEDDDDGDEGDDDRLETNNKIKGRGLIAQGKNVKYCYLIDVKGKPISGSILKDILRTGKQIVMDWITENRLHTNWTHVPYNQKLEACNKLCVLFLPFRLCANNWKGLMFMGRKYGIEMDSLRKKSKGGSHKRRRTMEVRVCRPITSIHTYLILVSLIKMLQVVRERFLADNILRSNHLF